MTSTSPLLPPDVSSLRAAALMTLRSKPRSRLPLISQAKRTSPDYTDDNSSVASTRRAGKSPELDYGSDDGLADAEGSTDEEKDDDEKEEGEISEDEAPPAPKPPLTSVTMMDVDEEPVPGLTSSSNRRIQNSGNLPAMRELSSPSVTGGGSVGAIRSNAPRPSSLLSDSSTPRMPEATTQSESMDSRAHSLSTKPLIPITRLSTPLLPVQQSSGSSGPVSSDVTRSKAKYTERGNMSLTSNVKFTHVSAMPTIQTTSVTGAKDVDDHGGAFVRPSVRMTVEEFAEAKTIILDLLGWGVPSEYFINCGLTREAIYYAFTELNLKLPENLDMNGLVPYPSHHDNASPMEPVVQTQEPVPLVNAQHKSNLQGRSPSVAPHGPNNQVTPLKSSIPTSQPLKPSVAAHPPDSSSNQHNRLSTQVGPAKGLLTSEEVSNGKKWPLSPSDPIPGLQGHLLASLSTISPSSSTGPVTDAPKHGYAGNLDEIETLRRKELLARKAVLASRKLKAAASNSRNSPTSAGPSKSQSIPAETVDNFLKSITSDPVSTEVIDRSRSPRTNATDSMEVDAEPKPSTSGKGRSAAWSNPLRAETPKAEQERLISSRKSNLKRPVASDFVDYDGTSAASSMPSNALNTDVNNRPILSSFPSFANLVPSRKVVIDFSDTEEEETMEDVVAHPQNDSTLAFGRVAPRLSPMNSNGTRTPEAGIMTPSGAMTPKINPDMLLQKELEIRRMKLLIAERERSRLKKLAHSTSSTPPPATSIIATGAKTSAKPQGSIDGVLPSAHIDEQGIANDDVVMQDLGVSGTTSTDVTIQATDISSSEQANDADDEAKVAILEPVVTEEVVSSFTPISASTNSLPKASNITVAEEFKYMAYNSPLASFAPITPVPPVDLLSSSFLDSSLSLSQSFAFSSLSSTVSPLPSIPILQQLPALLRPLKESALRKLNPNKSICQFEIPGAGRCRDPSCANIHLRAFIPTDDEIAQYLAQILPAPQPTVQEIKATLARIRASKQDLDLDSYVSQTLLQLDIR